MASTFSIQSVCEEGMITMQAPTRCFGLRKWNKTEQNLAMQFLGLSYLGGIMCNVLHNVQSFY